MGEYFVVRINVNIYYSADVCQEEVKMSNNELSLGELIRRKGGWMIDHALTERLGVIVIDGRKVADGGNTIDLSDFFEVVDAIYGSREEFEWLTGTGSAWIDDVIFVGADVVDDARNFVVYHEYKHYLDYIGRDIVPSDEHASIRSSRIEKACDLYALQRVVREMGVSAAQKAIEWMVNYHFQWNVEHPDDPSDLLYRAVLLYRFCRRQGLSIDPIHMRELQKSQRWWR